MPQNKKIKIGSETLEFSTEEEDRVVIYKGTPYKFIADVVEACPQLLKDETDFSAFAEALNYLLFGEQFEVIVEVDNYYDKYWARKFKEAEEPSADPQIAMMWQADYDILIILPPVSEGELFFCFLENMENGLPYMLTTPFPITSYDFDFILQPIPFAQEPE